MQAPSRNSRETETERKIERQNGTMMPNNKKRAMANRDTIIVQSKVGVENILDMTCTRNGDLLLIVENGTNES